MQPVIKMSKKSVLATILSNCGISFGPISSEASIANLSDEKIETSLNFFIQDETVKNLIDKAEQYGLDEGEAYFFRSQILNLSAVSSNGPHPFV